MPRSLKFCMSKISDNLSYLEQDYGVELESLKVAKSQRANIGAGGIDAIFDEGLHEFLTQFLVDMAQLGTLIEQDFRFYG